ncbi:MAG: HD domain-containing protein [Candidatus Lambdaproteobacteria bacterium]|nr:HD domain-containing protein [Candidatus Lambdaproteobacteria bacterium]
MESRLPAQPDLLDMPALYFERTSDEEQARHRDKLARLRSRTELHIDPIQDAQGGWHVEIVTMDWDEPGLLDKIFEAILRCIHVPGGVAQKRIRIFTGHRGQVVNILELQDRKGAPLTRDNVELVLAQIRAIQPGTRSGIESIEHLPFTSLIPLVTEFPSIDNTRSDRYTYIELKATNLSNRFTSILLNILARSDLWLNIQVAEFEQQGEGHYAFWVVDKYGSKLKDSHFTRRSLIEGLQAMNRLILALNVGYIDRDWRMRIEHNERTIYHSRPDPNDFLLDMQNMRQLAVLKGFHNRLSALVEQGLLDSKAFYFLKKVEAFVETHRGTIQEARGTTPDKHLIALCREYFEYRRQALRILVPLFERLVEMAPVNPSLSDVQRLHAMAHPMTQEHRALDTRFRLYLEGRLWIPDPGVALDIFHLMARTDCFLREDTLAAIEGALEGWTPQYQEENRGQLGRQFKELLDESMNQSNTAIVLRNMRAVGLLQRYIPNFVNIRGLIHVIADHNYTVDEHTFIVVEVLEGLKLLLDVQQAPGKSLMRTDYEKIKDNVGLQNFARKYAMEMRMLSRITEMRSNPAIKPFLQMMGQVRENSLDFLVEMKLLEHGYALSMSALTEIESVRRQLDPLIRVFTGIGLRDQRCLILAALFHDLQKPAKDHPERMARRLARSLEQMGLLLPDDEVETIAWIVRHHLDVRDLMNRIGFSGEQVLAQYLEQVGDTRLVRLLILFTYADRVAVHLDRNKNAHDAMLLSEMLHLVNQYDSATARKNAGAS